MSEVAVVVFDLGGVLCRWLPERRLTALAAISDLPPATVDAQLFESGWDDACERGQFTAAETYDHLRTILGIPEGPDADVVMRAAWSRAYEPLASVLKVLPSIRCPTALLTNNGPITEDALLHELHAVGAAVDQVFLSWRLKAAKPSAECFAAATARLDVDPAAVLFVDDTAANVEAARAYGWQAHHFTDALNLRAALASVR